MAGARGRAPHGKIDVRPMTEAHCIVDFVEVREQGEEWREKCVVGARGRAPHGKIAVRPMTEAHCIVATHYLLFPPLFSLLLKPTAKWIL